MKNKNLMKSLLLALSILVFSLISCEANEPEVYGYRRQLTVETNLNELRIDNIYLDSTTMFPFILFDLVDAGGTLCFTIYPVPDSGLIKLNLYSSGKTYKNNPPLIYHDTLTIYTPIDTTLKCVLETSFNR